MNLREYRGEAKTLADLLLYVALVDDGVMLQRDGTMFAAWQYNGPDLDSASHSEMASLCAQINGAMKLGSGYMVQWIASRVHSPAIPESGFENLVLAVIETERREQYARIGSSYETAYFLVLTHMPPLAAAERLRGFFFSGTQKKAELPAATALRRFREACTRLEDRLTATLRLNRLCRNTETHTDDLLRFVRRMVTKNDYPCHATERGALIGHRLGQEDFVAGIEPKIGKYHMRIVSVGGGGSSDQSGFPRYTHPGLLGALDRLPMRYDWSNRLILLDNHESKSLFDFERKKWGSKVRGFMTQLFGGTGGAIDEDALAMHHEAQAAMGLAASGDVEFALYSNTITVYGETVDEVETNYREVIKAVNALGFEARVETINAVEAYLGSLPGDGYRDVRRVYIHTLNAADMAPVTSIFAGERINPSGLMPPNSPPLAMCSTTGATPYRLHLHAQDVGHTLMVGPTGAGKSTALGLLIAQWFRYPKAQVFSFDKGYSLEVLSHAADAEYYDLLGPGHAATLAFAPLRALDDASDVAFASEWIETLVTLNGGTWNPEHADATNRALKLLQDAPSHNRSLTEFVTTVQSTAIRAALSVYQADGAYGRLLDAQTDSLGRGRHQTFELEHLMKLGPKAVLPVLLYLFRQIEKRLTGNPTLVTIDEAWVFFAHELFQKKILDWLKTFRKKNTAVVLATQNLSDVFKSSIEAVLLENCPTKILLANPEAKSPETRNYYTRLGLNEREVDIVSAMQPKRHYYICKPEGRRVVSLGLGPVALAFLGASGDRDRAAYKALIKTHGHDGAPAAWLESRGLPDWAAFLTSTQKRGFSNAA